MNKKALGITILGVCISGATGCGNAYPDLKDDALAFNMGEYTDENEDDLKYGTIEYNGRTYMSYGILKSSIKSKNINECIGYIIQNENSSSVIDENNKDTRVYTLTEDSNENFLMVYFIGTTEMNQPGFWRAVDTKGEKIDMPNYIDSLDYNYWK